MRLIKNLDVAAGLINSATGTVMNVSYENADCGTLLESKNPPPYCIVVEFAGFAGFITKGGQRVYPFPNQPHWVSVYRQRVSALRSDLLSWQEQEARGEGLLQNTVSVGSVLCHDLPSSTEPDACKLYGIGRCWAEQPGLSGAPRYDIHTVCGVHEGSTAE